MIGIHDIHFVERTMSFKMVPGTDDEWTTGDWWLRAPEVEKIKGGNVYLHLSQKAGCHLGGEIIDCKPVGPDRVEIHFRSKAALAGQVAIGSWKQERLIARRESKAA